MFNFQKNCSTLSMFENETLVDLLRFDKIVQALTKALSKGPVRRTGVLKPMKQNLSLTNIGSIGAPRVHLRTHAHYTTLARTPAQ